MKYYPLVILDEVTLVGTARWGKGGADRARKRARDLASSLGSTEAQVFRTRVIRAQSRQDVRDLYAAENAEDWTSPAMRRHQ